MNSKYTPQYKTAKRIGGPGVTRLLAGCRGRAPAKGLRQTPATQNKKQVVRSGYHLLGAIEDGYLARSAPSRRQVIYTRQAWPQNVRLFLLQVRVPPGVGEWALLRVGRFHCFSGSVCEEYYLAAAGCAGGGNASYGDIVYARMRSECCFCYRSSGIYYCDFSHGRAWRQAECDSHAAAARVGDYIINGCAGLFYGVIFSGSFFNGSLSLCAHSA